MRLLARVALLLLCSWAWSGNLAWGHATLLASAPAPGAVLGQAPAQIVLTFSEPVSPAATQLLDAQGQDVALAAVRAQGPEVHIRLAPAQGRQHGSYLLSWRVVSADGHPVGGTLDYAVGAASRHAPQAHGTAGARHAPWIWLARWLTYVCLFGVAGAAGVRLLRPRDTPLWTLPLACGGLALLLADLALQGLDLTGRGWAGLAGAGSWQTALASSYAWTLGFLALALLLAISVLRSSWRANVWLAALGVPLLVAGALALSGHASTAPPPWLARPLVALHVLMVLAWVGSLWPLARALRPAGPLAPDLRLLRQFSAVIPWVVALLVGSGVMLVGLQLDRPADLWRTAYGRVLLAKLALVALLLLLAAANRWRWTAPVLAGSRPALRALRRAIVGELLLAAAVLAVVALWRFTPPPRSLDVAHAAMQQPAPVLLQEGGLQARLQPSGMGQAWQIRLQGPRGQPFAAQDVTLVLDNPEAGLAAVRAQAHEVAPGHWQADVPVLPQTGRWQPELVVLVDDFDQRRLHAPAPAHRASPAHPSH